MILFGFELRKTIKRNKNQVKGFDNGVAGKILRVKSDEVSKKLYRK